MATQKKSQQLTRQGANNRGSPDGFYIPPPSVMVDKNGNEQIVFVIALIAMMLILPLFLYLMASMYFDMLQIQQENKKQQAIIRRLIIQLENKK